MTKKPNFLFLFSDQHRGDWMPYDSETKKRLGVERLELHMPNIRTLMENGISFSCAISPAPICAPARACLASGKRYKQCRVFTNQVNYDSNLETFYKRLQSNGYFVSGLGKFDLNKADLDWSDHELLKKMGFTYAEDSEGKMDAVWAALNGKPGPYGRMLQEKGWLEAYQDDMLQRGNGTEPTLLPDDVYADNWITAGAIRMLKALPENQPWFMQVNFSGPHDPWDITASMKEQMKERRFPGAEACTALEENQRIRQNYAAMIENIDHNIGILIEELQCRGDFENTIIIYSSDHGEMMGDHNLYGKAKPGQGAVHIPMVISTHSFKEHKNVVNHSPIELQDLAATILDYAGVAVPDSLYSVSLRPVIEGKAQHVRSYAVSELVNLNTVGPAASFCLITDGTYKLIMRSGMADQLYKISEDPFECNDLAEQLPQIVALLRKAYEEQGDKLPALAAKYAVAFPISDEKRKTR